MEQWLKDKKNLPIVIGMAVFVLIAAGGLIAFELGLFNGNNTATNTVVAPTPAVSAPGTTLAGGPPDVPSGQPGPAGTPGVAGAKAAPGAKTAAAPAPLNPAKGPDPFNIPGGHKIYLQSASAQAGSTTAALRDILPPFNLFSLPSATPPVVQPPTIEPAAASNYVVTGIVRAGNGIFAILEVGGQSQTVKPGDALLDGGKVQSIQASSVTMRTQSGAILTVPLTGGTVGSSQPQNPPPGGQTFGGPPEPGQFGGPPEPGQFGGPPEPGQFSGPPDPGMQNQGQFGGPPEPGQFSGPPDPGMQ